MSVQLSFHFSLSPPSFRQRAKGLSPPALYLDVGESSLPSSGDRNPPVTVTAAEVQIHTKLSFHFPRTTRELISPAIYSELIFPGRRGDLLSPNAIAEVEDDDSAFGRFCLILLGQFFFNCLSPRKH